VGNVPCGVPSQKCSRIADAGHRVEVYKVSDERLVD
jgi:hypothetical protein